MKEPSKAAREKAADLRQAEVGKEPRLNAWEAYDRALARYIQHVSDVAKLAREYGVDEKAWVALESLILPNGPDPLEECLAEALGRTGDDLTEHNYRLREAITKRGGRIVFDD